MRVCRYLAASALLVSLLVFAPSPVTAAEEGEATLAHIRLHGDLDETPVAVDPLFGAGAENFSGKLERIRKARKDAAVTGLLLQLDGLQIGWGKVDELRQAITDFRASGKKAYAYLESGDTKDYLVALACDEVCVPEAGWLMLTGLRGGVTFYKDLFEKIGVQADMLQMGDFKGAAEPFTRNSMSPQLRQQLESVLDDYYAKSLIGTIIKGRPAKKWSVDDVKQIIDRGPYTAKSALAAGLIDRAAYADQLQDAIKKQLNVAKVQIKRNYGQAKMDDLDLGNPFTLLSKLLAPPKTTSSSRPKIAVIYATGTIVHGKGGEGVFGGNTAGSTTLVQAIRQAEQDKTVKAIVLRVDSPGGSALASDLIWNELNRSQKPVVASMGDVAASGGYYISMAARKIYAEPGTLTGSIGVVGGKLVIGGLEKKVGLNTEIITRGANANLLGTDTPFSATERTAMTALMKDVYEQFLEKALAGRKKASREMNRAEIDKLAAGRIWTGRQAKENGLIDELGTLEEAIKAAKVMAGVERELPMELLVLPKARTFMDTLIESRSETELTVPGLRLPHGLTQHLRALDGLLQLRGEPVWAVLPGRIEVK